MPAPLICNLYIQDYLLTEGVAVIMVGTSAVAELIICNFAVLIHKKQAISDATDEILEF
jgi:hypothetical protein